MKRVIQIFIALNILIHNIGCKTQSREIPYTKNKGYTLPFETVYSDTYSGIDSPGNYLIINKGDISKLPFEIQSKTELKVNDKSEMLIAFFAGRKSSGGYKINVDSLVCHSHNLSVYYHISPPPGPAIMVITQPCLIIKTPRCEAPVKWIKH